MENIKTTVLLCLLGSTEVNIVRCVHPGHDLFPSIAAGHLGLRWDWMRQACPSVERRCEGGHDACCARGASVPGNHRRVIERSTARVHVHWRRVLTSFRRWRSARHCIHRNSTYNGN